MHNSESDLRRSKIVSFCFVLLRFVSFDPHSFILFHSVSQSFILFHIVSYCFTIGSLGWGGDGCEEGDGGWGPFRGDAL